KKGGKPAIIVKEVVDAAQVSTAATTVTITTKEITLAQAPEALKTLKPKAKGAKKKKDQIRLDEEAAKKLQATFDEKERLAREKAKKEQEANIALIETWDDIQAKINADHQHFAAKRAKEKKNKPPTKAQQRKIMCTYLKNMEGYKLRDLKLKEFDSIQEMFDKALKRFTETIPDEKEVTIDAIPLAVKSPKIVDWKIHKKGKKSYHQIVRANGKSQMYMIFSQMLKSFDREDLEDFYKLEFALLKSGIITRYTDDTLHILGLHEDQRIFGFVRGLRTRSLVEFLSTYLLTTYKGLMEKTYTWIEAREVETNGALNDQREGFDRSKKNLSWDNNKGQKNRDMFSSFRGSNHRLLSSLSKSPREILATEKVVKTFEQPPLRMLGNRRSHDMTKYCHFHENHGHDTKDCRGLRHQIEEAVKLRQLSHLVKGIKKQKAKASDTQRDAEESITVNNKHPEQTIIIRKQLPVNFNEGLRDLLRSNAYVFAWTHADMTGIPRTIMVGGKPLNTEHKLNEYKHINPVKQKKRRLGPDHSATACKEIDWKVESPLGFRIKYFMDAYKGYHQIQMAEEDEDKTAFFVRDGTFCYRKMPFGLKNIGATYQRLVDKVFSDQIRWDLEAYVDDMEGPSLGHLNTKQGIRDNPLKVKAVTDLKPSRTLKDIQSLNGKLVALDRFLSKDAVKSLPFFKTLKSCTDKKIIKWMVDAEEAFQKMKKFMEILPTLTAPIKGELLIMYLTASAKSISASLLAEREGRQVPIYFVSRVLQGAKINYLTLEKLMLTLVQTAKRLQMYFQASLIMVLTDAPIKQKLTIPEKSGCRTDANHPEGKEHTYALRFRFETTNNEAEYETLLAGLQIAQEMEIRSLAIFADSQLMVNQIKGLFEARQPTIQQYLQKVKEIMKEVLVEVLSKRSIDDMEVSKIKAEKGENWMTPIYEYLLRGLLPEDPKESRKIRADNVIKEIHEGSCGFNMEPRSMVVKVLKQGHYWPSMYRDTAKIIQDCTQFQEQSMVKKVSGKDAIAAGNTWPFSHLGIAQEMEIRSLAIFADSQLMVNQIKGLFEARQPTIQQYLQKVKEIMKEVLVEVLSKRSIDDMEVSKIKAEKGENWMTPIYEYLLRGLLPEDPKESRKIRADNVIKEIHEGSCGFNMEPRSMVVKVLKQGHYWPSMYRDTAKIIQDCTQFQEQSMENAKRKEGEERELASIEDAYFHNKLRRYHNARSNRFNFKLGDFVLLSLRSTDSQQVWQGPHMVNGVYEGELYKITDASDYSLVQTVK
nr:hypothetical protein [Tanacetum cinerariifolium]